jgi:DNA-binding CsgD family transcriptional regulator
LVALWTAHGHAAAAVALGEWQSAAALLTQAGGADLERVAPIDRTRPRLNLIEAALRDGRLDDARRWAAEGMAWADHAGLEAQRGWALVGQALVAGASASNSSPAELAGAAVAAFERAGARLEAERARTLHARLLGDRAGAVAALELAEARLHALGAEADRGAAVRELRRLGRRAPRREAAAAATSLEGRLASLSRREREVAELVARGATNQSIADTLFLSVKTVESHLRNIFAKAGVSSRDALAAAVNRAARSGDAA